MYCFDYIFLVFLLYLPNNFAQNIHTNSIDKDIEIETNEITDTNPFQDIIANTESLFKNNAGGDIENIISNVFQTEGKKTLENILMGAITNSDPTNQILSGISSILNQNNAGAAINPQLIGNVLSLLTANNEEQQKSSHEPMGANIINIITDFISQQQVQTNQEDTTDVINLIGNTVGNLFANSGENPVYLLLSAMNSFTGSDAIKRAKRHESHASILPPILEKIHLYYDHFRNTELYNSLWRITGAEKFFHKFMKDGEFNFGKFFDSLENKTFRKHWIQTVIKKITDTIAIATDSSKYKKYGETTISLFNGFLSSLHFPKSTRFDITRPDESLTNLFDYCAKKFLTLNINSAQYVKPVIFYIKEILRLSHAKGILSKNGLNSDELSQKLTNTLNLEMIEPILRVWRAYRFAKKVPECDKYVMCAINQIDINEEVSVPGLKQALSKTASIFASWFLSEKTKTSFWTLYSTINDEKDCSIRFFEQCNKFHIDEKRVDSEYIHTEL